MSIDGYVGIWTRIKHGNSNSKQDSKERHSLRNLSEAFAAVSDAAFTIKHGFLKNGGAVRSIDDWIKLVDLDTVWNDDGRWDDELSWTDKVIALNLQSLDGRWRGLCAADELAKQAWNDCKELIGQTSITPAQRAIGIGANLSTIQRRRLFSC